MEIEIYSICKRRYKMKYELTNEDLQAMAEKLKNVIQVKYKEDIGDIPDHVVDALTQIT